MIWFIKINCYRFQNAEDILVEKTRVRIIVCDLNFMVPPEAFGPAVQSKSVPRSVSTCAKTPGSSTQPAGESFWFVHVRCSLMFSSLDAFSNTRLVVVSVKRSTFFTDTDAMTPIITMTEINSIKVKPSWFSTQIFLNMVFGPQVLRC